jgi:GNAT superfamily N-acetyltransferase
MIRIRPMSVSDIPCGMRLKEQARWNQIEADWIRYLNLEPDGCFLAELDGAAVGTVATCTFRPVAWIAMALVDEAVRGRGIGKALMRHALDYLDARGIRSIRLDATALGQPLYEKLGFAAEYRLTRFEGVLPTGSAPSLGLPASSAHYGDLMALDREATGTNRAKFLGRLFAERPEAVQVFMEGDSPTGFLTTRKGSRALQIGPCIASPAAGPMLLRDAFHRHAGQRVYVDIPVDNEPARWIAEAQGLIAQRDFMRMSRGPRVADWVDRIWASSGPELG